MQGDHVEWLKKTQENTNLCGPIGTLICLVRDGRLLIALACCTDRRYSKTRLALDNRKLFSVDARHRWRRSHPLLRFRVCSVV